MKDTYIFRPDGVDLLAQFPLLVRIRRQQIDAVGQGVRRGVEAGEQVQYQIHADFLAKTVQTPSWMHSHPS